MMCEHYSELLSAYLDDEVALAERAWIEGHLIGCAGCREELRALRETARVTAFMPEILPPPDLRSRILLRTSQRPSVWVRVRTAALRPAVWTPTLGVGVAGVILLATTLNPHPTTPSTVAHSPLPPSLPPVTQRTEAPAAAPKTPVAKAPVPKATEALPPRTGLKGIFARIEETLNPSPAPTLVPSPVAKASKPAPKAPPTAQKKSPPAAPSAIAKTPSAPSSSDPLDRMKKSIASVGVKIKGRLSDKAGHKKPGSKTASPDRASDKATPESMASEEEWTIAMEPPMVKMPDTPAMPVASPPAPTASEEEVDVTRPSNPVASHISKLAESPKKKSDIDEVVDQLNANALTTASAARQIKWKFARYKF